MLQITQLGDVPMVASDDNSASTGFFPLFDEVNFIETLPGIGGLELLSQLVVADASGVYHGFWREDVLSVLKPLIRMDVK